MDALSSLIEEIVTTGVQTEPVSAPSSRKRRAVVPATPKSPSPAASNSEDASANMRTAAKLKSGVRSRRKAIDIQQPNGRAPSAPLSASADADEAIVGPPPNAGPPRRQKKRAVHQTLETQCLRDSASDDGAQRAIDAHTLHSPVVAEITHLWRMRQRWHRAEKSLVLQGKALCRSWTNGDKEAANKLFEAAAKGEASAPILAMALMPFLAAIENFAPERDRIEKELRKLAKSLPVYSWTSGIKGFGELNLAALTGECGDIGSYRSPSALWKRMGLAVINGGRQRRVADADLALEHGYNPSRRAVAYLLGECLVKAGEGCPYRSLYAARKDYELSREDESRPKSQGHAHNRAARHITKRALRDLWVAWRAADRSRPGNAPHQPLALVSTLAEAA